MLYLILLCLAASGLITYLVPFVINTFVFKSKDLKKAYNAKWAVVTGASSGMASSSHAGVDGAGSSTPWPQYTQALESLLPKSLQTRASM